VPVKVTMYFSLANYSWSETHYYLLSTAESVVHPYTVQLANYRARLLGDYANLSAIRLSTVPSNRNVTDIDPSEWSGAGFVGTDTGMGDVTAERPYSSLLLLFTGQVSQKNMYLGGLPDEIIQTTPTSNTGYVPSGDWQMRFNQWSQYLVKPDGTSQWGFRSRFGEPGIPITSVGLATGVGSNIGLFSMVNLGVPVGSDVYLTGFRRSNTRQPGLSGSYQVIGIIPPGSGVTSWETILGETGNVVPSNFISMGTAQPLVYQYVPYIACTPRRATSRKRGGSFGRPRGRLRART
jgi:hypothetical protein